MWKPNVHRVWVAIVLASCALFLFTAQLWPRLMLPPSMADVRELAGRRHWFFAGTFSQLFRLRSTRNHFPTFTGITLYLAPCIRRRFRLTVGIGERDQRKKRCNLHIPEKSSPMGTIASISALKRIGLYLPTKWMDDWS